VDHDLVDQAAEECFLLRRRQAALAPQRGDVLAGLQEGRAFFGAEVLGGMGSLLLALGLLLGVLEFP